MKRERLSLGERVAVICEGGAETAIMEMLLDADRLIFTERDLFYGEIIRCRSAETFEQRYLKINMNFKLTIIRVLDSRKENFRLGCKEGIVEDKLPDSYRRGKEISD